MRCLGDHDPGNLDKGQPRLAAGRDSDARCTGTAGPDSHGPESPTLPATRMRPVLPAAACSADLKGSLAESLPCTSHVLVSVDASRSRRDEHGPCRTQSATTPPRLSASGERTYAGRLVAVTAGASPGRRDRSVHAPLARSPADLQQRRIMGHGGLRAHGAWSAAWRTPIRAPPQTYRTSQRMRSPHHPQIPVPTRPHPPPALA